MEDLSLGHVIILGLITLLSGTSALLLGLISWNWKNFTSRVDKTMTTMFGLFNQHVLDETKNFKDVTELINDRHLAALERIELARKEIIGELRNGRNS